MVLEKTKHFTFWTSCCVMSIPLFIYLFFIFIFGAMCTQQILQEILHLDHVVYIIIFIYFYRIWYIINNR